MSLEVWTVLPLFQPSVREVLGMVRAAESLGMAGVLATDHLAGWRRASGPVLEATTVLGMVGAVARRRVGSLVLQTSLRPAAYTADVVQTLAAITRAPPLIGLGVGDSRSRREAHRLGLGFASLPERIVRLKETIAAIRSRTPGAEIWVGGWRPEILEVAAEMADGWNGWGKDPAAFAATAGRVRDMNPRLLISWGGLADSRLEARSQRRMFMQRVEAGAQALVVAFTPPRVATLTGWAPRLFADTFIRSGGQPY